MNKKILKILEFGEITKRLSELAITEPATNGIKTNFGISRFA